MAETDLESRLRAIEEKLDRLMAFTGRLENLLNAYLSGGKGAALLALAKIHSFRRGES